jgi:hypothetical protein
MRKLGSEGEGMKKRILFICGSKNQTTQMHQIAMHLQEHDCAFTPYYVDGYCEWMRKVGWLDFTISGPRMAGLCVDYCEQHGLKVDYQGKEGNYDLVFTCIDVFVPKNVRQSKLILVQEGMTDPENYLFWLAKTLKFLPRWIAGTSMNGLSLMYDRFCVASEGYREFFIRKGSIADRIAVTGIPNFDDFAKFLQNDFPLSGYFLVCTNDLRECKMYENRKKFIQRGVKLAGERQLVFKIHPNEKLDRAKREIEQYAPGALIYTEGSAEEMIANCDGFLSHFSTTTYVALTLGKEVHSDIPEEELRRLAPLQHGQAAVKIAAVARELLEAEKAPARDQSWNAKRRRLTSIGRLRAAWRLALGRVRISRG